MVSNTAAWQVEAKAPSFEIKESPYTSPKEGEIVIKNAAVAVNPVDWALFEHAIFPIQYPAILGFDVAGEVVEVGPGVTQFKPGDRAMALCSSYEFGAPYGGFQQYTVAQAISSSVIPDSVTYVQATTFPLALATAAVGLYDENQLHLPLPSLDPKPSGQTVIIWAGASSVGCHAIQLAVASGYEVFTTASPKNFDLMKKVGASQSFDYNSPTVVDDIVTALEGKTVAGAVAIVSASLEPCSTIVSRTQGRKFVSSGHPIRPDTKFPAGVESNFILAGDVRKASISPTIFGEFVPKALAEGKYIVAPEPWVVGHGLEALQGAIAAMKEGVSAKKIVVTL